jgi:hypothetical protein
MSLEGSMKEWDRIDHIFYGVLYDRGGTKMVNYTHEIFLVEVSLLT